MASASEVLVTLGGVGLVAAIVGGGLSAFHVDVPLIRSLVRQALLAIVSVIFLFVGLYINPPDAAQNPKPSQGEQREWASAERQSGCEAFDKIYAEGGFYSDAAKRRRDLAEYRSGPEKMSFPVSLPLTKPLASHVAALDQLHRDSARAAEELCSQSAGLYAGQTAPGAFQAKSAPTCERHTGGYVCTVSGTATCSFIVPHKVKICPRK